MGAVLIAIVAVVGMAFLALMLAAAIVLMMFFSLYLECKANRLPVGLLDMVMMRLRGVAPAQVVHTLIALLRAGIEVTPGQLEAHLLSGGDLRAVSDAMISAQKADLGVDFAMIAAIDLAGRDVVDAVRTRVNPKVLLCPPADSGQAVITGVAQDGIRLGARARVTVRTELRHLIGGAGEDTIIARVGEGIVAAMGRVPSHREILETPERISEYLLAKGLDSGTCFEILSVDIADVDVFDNVAARLKSSQAAADKRIAQARAEVRRAAAVASHQEMTARTVDMHSRVTAARSNVPLALSSALAEANVGCPKPLPAVVNPRMRWRWGQTGGR